MLQMVNRINLANGLYPILVIAGGLVVFSLTCTPCTTRSWKSPSPPSSVQWPRLPWAL